MLTCSAASVELIPCTKNELLKGKKNIGEKPHSVRFEIEMEFDTKEILYAIIRFEFAHSLPESKGKCVISIRVIICDEPLKDFIYLALVVLDIYPKCFYGTFTPALCLSPYSTGNKKIGINSVLDPAWIFKETLDITLSCVFKCSLNMP